MSAHGTAADPHVMDHERKACITCGARVPDQLVRAVAPGRCGAPKPHFDPNGERDGWRDCGQPEVLTKDGTHTGRCVDCLARSREKRYQAQRDAELGQGTGGNGRSAFRPKAVQ